MRRPKRAAHTAKVGPVWRVTDHAVEQYVSRVEPACPNFGAGKHRLLSQARGAVRLDDRTPLGDERWRCADGSVLIVKQEHHTKVIVTVIARSEADTSQGLPEEVA